jgi:glycosyltransferase involved in cell wall biosynthesis
VKIAIFMPNLMGGGAEKVFVNLSNEFYSLGYSVDIILANRSGPYITDLHSEVRIFDLKQARVGKCIWRLVKYLTTNKPNILLSGLLVSNIVALYSGWISNVKVIPCIHSIESVAIGLEHKYKRKVVKFLYPLLLNKAASIIAVSHGVADDLSRATGVSRNNVNVIYNPILTDSLLMMSKEAIDEPWFNKDEHPMLLSAGRLNDSKDYVTLLKAFELLNQRVSSTLIVLGDGEQRQYLRKLVLDMHLGERVLFPGFVSNPYKFMSAADVFVLSSKRESFGNVIVEAMACGCQIVSTDCPYGPSEILESGKWGTLVPVGDYRKLSHVLYDAVRYSSDKPNVRNRANDFLVSTVARQYLTVINKFAT